MELDAVMASYAFIVIEKFFLSARNATVALSAVRHSSTAKMIVDFTHYYSNVGVFYAD